MKWVLLVLIGLAALGCESLFGERWGAVAFSVVLGAFAFCDYLERHKDDGKD